MKKIRFVGMTLLALFMSVSFSACGGSDDDDNNGGGNETSTSIEGTWYMKSVTWYNYYTDGTKEEKRSSDNRTYADYAEDEIWKLAKSGNNYIWTEIEKGYSPETHTWEKLGNNEFKCSLDGKNHKIVITSIERNKMVLEWTEDYDGEPSTSKGSKPHYSVGVHTLLRK